MSLRAPVGLRVVLVGLVIFALGIGPTLLDPYGRTLVVEIAIWSMLALSFGLVFGFAGMLSFCQSLFFGAGVYAVALAFEGFGWTFWWGLAAGVFLPVVLALTLGVFLVRLRGHNFVIGSVIASLIAVYLILSDSEFTGGDDGLPFSLPAARLGSLAVPLGDDYFKYYMVVIVAILILLSVWRVITSPLGRMFLAARDNEVRLEFLGYRPERVRLAAFVLAGAVAGLGGVLYASVFRYASVQLLRWTTSGEAVMWCLLGGVGTIVGPVIGTTALVMAKDHLSSWLERSYPIFVGLGIILVVIRFPGGLVGLLSGRRVLVKSTAHGEPSG